MENRRGGELIGAVIVFFVILFVYTKLLGPIPFTVNNINTLNSTPFEVQGRGSTAAAPDKSEINIGVTSQANTVEDAQQNANQAAQRIIEAVKDVGIDEKDIKTTNYSITPNYNLTGETQRITGYTVSQNFEIEAPIEKTNQVIDVATRAGANIVGNVTFKLDDRKEQALKNQARREAVDNAKASAEGLAKASGVNLGEIINIRESFGGGTPQPLAREAVAQDVESPQPTNITPGESNIEVTVVLTYSTN